MTRINCIPVEELTDQHLLAEYREITRVAKLAKPLDDYGQYKMSTGHVKFFYNKGEFLSKRTQILYTECKRRGFAIQYKQYIQHPPPLNEDWHPTIEDEMVSAARINEKIDANRGYYRYWHKPI